MKDEITIESLVDELLMSRSYPNSKTLFIIVEGEDDQKFFQKFFDYECEYHYLEGKQNVIDTITILNTFHEMDGYIGIIDADYDRIIPNNHPFTVENLYITDFHDIEIYYWKKEKIMNILAEYCIIQKLYKKFSTLDKILDCCCKNAKIIGTIRLISERFWICLVFKTLKYEKFINLKSFQLNTKNFCKELVSNSKNNEYFLLQWENFHCLNEISNINELINFLIRQYNNEINKDYDIRQLVCGHDLIKILTVIVNTFGNTRGKIVRYSSIENDLRVNYNSEDFFQTNLYLSLKEWDKIHSNFTLFNI